MEKMFPPKPPIELVVQPIIGRLLTLFGQNGYHNVALALVVHDMDTAETFLSGNLTSNGLEAILSSALDKIMREGPGEPVEKPN